MEHGYRDEQTQPNAKPAFGSVEEKLETIQDDVNLLKIEIKQTLVDLREFILNSQTGFLPRTNGAHQPPGPILDEPPYSESGNSPGNVAEREGSAGQALSNCHNARSAPDHDPVRPVHRPVEPADQIGRDSREGPRSTSRPQGGDHSSGEPVRRRTGSTYPETLQEPLAEARDIGEIDVEMLVKLLAWLDSIKGKGITAEQVRPFLQAYEVKGTLTATMSTIILQSIRAIGLKGDDRGDSEFSSEEYLGYLQQLHAIVCGAQQGGLPSSSEPVPGIRRVKAGPAEQT